MLSVQFGAQQILQGAIFFVAFRLQNAVIYVKCKLPFSQAQRLGLQGFLELCQSADFVSRLKSAS